MNCKMLVAAIIVAAKRPSLALNCSAQESYLTRHNQGMRSNRLRKETNCTPRLSRQRGT